MVLLDLKECPPAFLPATDTSPLKRRTAHVSSVADVINSLDLAQTVEYEHRATEYDEQRKRRIARLNECRQKRRALEHNWNPLKDPKITGELRNTLIIARIPYTATSEQLAGIFSQYGEISGIRIVENRGYAFIVFKDQDTCRLVMQETGGTTVIGKHNAIIDYCKSYQSQFKPRKLGGGLGGRFTLQREKDEIVRRKNILNSKRIRRVEPKYNRRDARSYEETPPQPLPMGRTLRKY